MDWFWLPANFTWEQLEANFSEIGMTFPRAFELTPSLYVGAILAGVQVLVQKNVLTRLGAALGIVHTAADGSYFRNTIKETKEIRKFNESAWRLVCYTSLWIYGATTLVSKPWFWNTKDYWHGYPYQPVDFDLKLYYLGEMSLYISFLITHVLETKRKDFWILLFHHLAALVLLFVSWGTNCIRLGSAVLLCHDTADIPMELTKLGIYLKMEKLKTAAFITFVLSWFATRLWIYPFHLVWTCFFEHDVPSEMLTLANMICQFLILSLLVLHLFWSYFILKMIAGIFTSNGVPNDSRSSDEGDDKEDAGGEKKEM